MNSFATQPDGLYVFYAPEEEQAFVDVIAVEVCGGRQNFADKRSRYASSTVSLGLYSHRSWLRKDATVAGGGTRPRWKAAGTFLSGEPHGDSWLGVRSLRVLYVLEDALYAKWKVEGVPEAHEFVTRYRSLRTYNSQQMQRFLRGMVATHFYP